MQPEVPGTSLCGQEVWVDSLAIIANPQSKLMLIITELHFNLLRLGMSECIAQRLTCDAVDLVTHDRVQIPRCAFDIN